MALKKQSIRQGVHVIVNGKLATKDELIKLSETWTERKEIFFRKMLQQGGVFSMDGDNYLIKIRENTRTRSDSSIDGGIKQIPGDSRF